MPSGGVAVRDCVVVPAPPLVSPEEKAETGEIVDAQAFVTATIFRICSTVRFVSMLKCNMGGLGETLGATVREEHLLALWCADGRISSAVTSRRSGLEAYKKRGSPEVLDVVVGAGWNHIEEQVHVWSLVENEGTHGDRYSYDFSCMVVSRYGAVFW